jgi:hypothetical protein
LCDGFSKQRGNHQEEAAEGDLCRFPRLRQFPQASALFPFFPSLFVFEPPLQKLVKISRQDRL